MSETKFLSILNQVIINSGLKKKSITSYLGVSPQKFSRVLKGQQELNEQQKKDLCKILKKEMQELFPEIA